MATRFCHLPERAVVEIMSWLPPDALVKCKCVQKSWHSLIDTLIKTRWFVAKHLKNSGSRSSFVFLTGYGMNRWTHLTPHYYITDNLLVNSYKVCEENDEIHFDTKLLTSTKRPKLVKAEYLTSLCNGIIFQTESESNKTMLCNPTTREFKHLDPDLSCFFGSDFKTFMSGFGYDVIDNVYKVVRVVNLPSSSRSGGSKSASFGAEVCTLGSNQGDSCWREIRMIDVGKYFTTGASSGMYHRGFVYWLLCNVDAATERMIISFDMHDEDFQVVPLPSGIVDDPMEFNTVDAQNRVTKVGKGVWFCSWNQCPTLLKIVTQTLPWEADVPKPVEVWTMNTDSSSTSHGRERFSCWVEQPTFFPPLERFYPVAFWKSDELLLNTVSQPRFASYNLRTQKVRVVQLHPQTAIMFLFAFVDVKSLVSINNYLS